MVDISREVRMRPCSLRLLWSTAVFLAALLSAAGCRAPTSDASALSAQDVAAIKATLETWKQASLAGDWPAFFGHFTEDAVWIGPNGPPVEGLATIQQGTWFRALEEELVPVQIDGRGDLAFARGTLSLLLDQKGAGKREGTFLTILRKQPGGSWRMAVYSFAF